MINAISANMNVADYCAAMTRNEIVVNRDYQRSDKVWPVSAKSYLIESIILGYPIPKFYLYSVADPKNRRTMKEIVDGQQRSKALLEFLNDGFLLTNTLDTVELRGLTYSTLGDYQGPLLSYILSIDQFIGATPVEVRQVFRRMNSYTVPLNPEELRHADHQGVFKWFISRLATDYSENLLSLSVFRDKDVIRMQDLKLLTEVVHALENGVSTTARKSLDKIYATNDASFDNLQMRDKQMRTALATLSTFGFLKGTNLAKPYQVYSLLIALILENDDYETQHPGSSLPIDLAKIEPALLELSAHLDEDPNSLQDPDAKAFVLASSERTNVRDQRNTRIRIFRAAIQASV